MVMKIAVDLDNTLIDELGKSLRPGAHEFLKKLSNHGSLVLWSSSSKNRGLEILTRFALRDYFEYTIFREDYLSEKGKGRKDLADRKIDVLIDDDMAEISFNKRNKRIAIWIPPYRGGEKDDLSFFRVLAEIERSGTTLEKIKRFFRLLPCY